jgi:hypothetical protein
MTLNPRVTCHQCGKECKDWLELARHIVAEKKTHKVKKDRTWALSFISKRPNQVEINRVANDPDKIKTDFGEENRQNRSRQLSGEQVYANVVCPKCKKIHRPLLEMEFTKDCEAWRLGDRLVKLCQGCEH